MSKKARILMAVIGLAAVILVVWAVSTVPEAPVPLAQPEKRVMSYENNTISEEKNGRKLWELTSDKIEVDVNTRDMKMVGITGHFYAEDGKIAELKADSGIYGGESKDITLEGNVLVTYSDGAVLTSQELQWQNEAETLTAVGNARATREDVLITADRIEASDSFNKLKAIGHAHIEKDAERAKAVAAEQMGGKSDEKK